MTPLIRQDAGMTLLETLVSLFLIALIATGGSVMLIQSVQGARMVDARGAEAREIERALATLRHDFAAFTGRPARTGDTSGPATGFDGRASVMEGPVLSFVRNGWADPGGLAGRSDLQRVEYAFERGALIRRSWRAPDPGPATPYTEQRLLQGLEAMDIRYGAGTGWRRDWRANDASDAETYPDRVEITLRLATDDEILARFRLGLRG